MPVNFSALPSSLNAALLLADGTVFWGRSFGGREAACGEICFNTAMAGYQEVLTDPSYAGQLVAFTFPHIGNVGCNAQDVESREGTPGAKGLIVREPVSAPSNFRSDTHFSDWLAGRGIAGISGIDTRALTRLIRRGGAQNAMIVSGNGRWTKAALEKAAETLAQRPSLEGMELGREAGARAPYEWTQPRWSLHAPHAASAPLRHHVVAVDYGAKLNILRALASLGCRITVVPADTTAEAILRLAPDGVFLSNGPGDPAETARYAAPVIRALVEAGMPLFGICLGHQLLGLAFGAGTRKMHQGHRGVNHPIRNLETGGIEITSQNHGFVVSDLPNGVSVSISAFSGSRGRSIRKQI